MSKEAHVSLHIDERLRDDLDRLAVLDGRSRNDLCLHILSSYVYGRQPVLNLISGPSKSTGQSAPETTNEK